LWNPRSFTSVVALGAIALPSDELYQLAKYRHFTHHGSMSANACLRQPWAVPHGSVDLECNFYGDLYCDGFAAQHCRLEPPRPYRFNRFFVKATTHALYHADMTRAAVGFDNDT